MMNASKQFNDGGPAFPVENSAYFHVEAGMSLRDYFAGQALHRTLARYDLYHTVAARVAYEIADAMLKERERIKCQA